MSKRWLMRQSKPAHRWLFIVIAVGMLSGVVMIIQAGILAWIIDHVYLHHATRASLFPVLISLLCTIVLRAVLSAVREMVAVQTAKTIKTRVRKTITQALMRLSPLELSRYKTGALTSTLIEQVEALHSFFADYLPQMTLAVMVPLMILIVVFFQNWLASVVLLLTAPLIPLFMALIGINTTQLNQQNFQTLSRMSSHFLDLLQGLTTLALFHRAKAQTTNIANMSNQFREKTMRILRIAFLSSSTLELFSTLAIAMIAVYLGLGLLGFVHVGFKGVHITLTHALFILLLAPEFYSPLRQLGAFYHARSEAMGAANEIMNILDNDKQQKTKTSIYIIEKNSVIQFRAVDYAYYASQKVLNHFNFTIIPGEIIAISGDSGTGKTTLLNLIAKLILPNAGSITVNDVPLQIIDDDTWREHISYLHQNPRLFHGNIIDNICCAKPAATDPEVHDAAKKCGVTDFSDHFPHGLYTMIGEHYRGLSGGQAQRVALARMVLKNAPVILLDEPTAHLDDANADLVLRLLDEWKNIKTMIVATHDQRIVAMANQVIAM